MAEPVYLSEVARFEDLLPSYVNGTLTPSDHAWVESYLARHPEARAELEWLRALAFRLGLDEPEFDAASEERVLERTIERIRGARTPAQLAPPSLFARVRRWLAQRKGWRYLGWMVPARVTPLGALACAVIAFQAALLGLTQREMNDLYAAARAPGVSVPNAATDLVRLTFRLDSREEDIRLALAAVGGRIVGGPGRLGDYYVKVELPLADALERLRAARGVESAVGVDAVPLRD